MVVPPSTGVAAGFNAPISGVFFAVETVLQRPCAVGVEGGAEIGDPSGGTSSGLTVAMVLLASVLAAVVSQVRYRCPCSTSGSPPSLVLSLAPQHA